MKKYFVALTVAVITVFVFQVILGLFLYRCENIMMNQGTEAPGCIETLYSVSVLDRSDIKEIVAEDNCLSEEDPITKMYINNEL